MELSHCSSHHNVKELEIMGPCWERGKPCTLCENEKLRALLERFMEFQISDYDRVATRAQDYCAIRRDARKLLQSFETINSLTLRISRDR